MSPSENKVIIIIIIITTTTTTTTKYTKIHKGCVRSFFNVKQNEIKIKHRSDLISDY